MLATALPGGAHALLIGDEHHGALPLDEAILAEARRALAADESRSIATDQGRIFLHVFNPAAAADHRRRGAYRRAAVANGDLRRLPGVAGRPTARLCRARQFQGFDIIDDWPDEAIEKLALDERAAVVTLTHDPKLDDAALRVALRSKAFYIGCLGSKKTHAARLVRLRGWALAMPNWLACTVPSVWRSAPARPRKLPSRFSPK